MEIYKKLYKRIIEKSKVKSQLNIIRSQFEKNYVWQTQIN